MRKVQKIGVFVACLLKWKDSMTYRLEQKVYGGSDILSLPYSTVQAEQKEASHQNSP